MKNLLRRLILWAISDDLRTTERVAVGKAVAQCEPKVVPPPIKYEVGDRVKGSPTCGFHAGFTGVVKYVEPNGTLWVRRDGASSDVFYKPHEVEHV